MIDKILTLLIVLSILGLVGTLGYHGDKASNFKADCIELGGAPVYLGDFRYLCIEKDSVIDRMDQHDRR